MTANFAAIKSEAEATTRAGHLHDIEQFSASRFLFLRFNFTTGDAAGQNLTGKATRRACAWIQAHYAGIKDFCLEANHLLLRQAKALSAEGKRVTIVTPGRRDLAVMGANLMDPRRRQDVLEVSLRTSADSLATLDRVRSRAA